MTTKAKAPKRAPKEVPVKPAAPLGPLPLLFRRVDWVACLITFVAVWTVYLLTLAPEVTLEDSGELVTGSYYAGIPHPPGYPVWTIYSWLWTVLVPFGNIAWRVALAEATAGALSCGLIALIVCRGSGFLLEGIPQLSTLPPRHANPICLISGAVAGLLMGLDGFMWRESVAVNRIAVSSVPWFMLVLVCLLRWLYAPHRYRSLYWALFLFGICFTTHQSLVVAAMGIEVLIAARNPRLGRDVFLGNGLVYLTYNAVLVFSGEHLIHNIGAKPGLLLLFHAIGVGSLLASAWLAIRTRGLLTEWKPVLILGLLWLLGASFYFYMPLSGMTNPPMQWDYPRTVDGFLAALSRGQYEQPNPVNVLTDSGRFFGQLGMLFGGLVESFTWICVFIALVPFAFFRRLQPRERSWLLGLAAIYLCLGVLLMILLNPTPDRSASDLVKVFFNSSHTIVAVLIGHGLALTTAWMATNYARFRRLGLAGGIVATLLALFSLLDATGRHYLGPAGQIGISELPYWIGRAFRPHQYGLPIYANLLLVALALMFVCAVVCYRTRAPLAVTLGLFASLPLYSGLAHWFECDQRGHMFGYWFGHDMFRPPFARPDGKPIFPEMTRNAVLFGGTDPGRFCPTYMIFTESFTPHRCQPAEDRDFDRRDVYIITQNALADPPYQNYIRAHYNRSQQIDPPFFREFFRMLLRDKEYETNLLARAAAPFDRFFTWLGARVEKQRRTYTSWFSEKDFTNITALAAKLRPCPQQDAVSDFVYSHLSERTQGLLANQKQTGTLSRSLAADFNRLLEREDFFDPKRWAHIPISEYLRTFIQQNPQGDTRVRLNRLLFEAAYPEEIVHSLAGIYPDREIYIPSAEDGARCFNEYMQDLQRRIPLNQIKPGEDIKVVGDRLQASGQGAVMAINGLVAKVIFDHNPGNEFFVEESAPIDWMYPYLTPSGVIMKLNRQPLTSMPEDILQRDHDFWKQYTARLCGDFVDYDTSVKELTDRLERIYVRRDFEGFTGDRKFIHDIDAQKAFSKLRSAIAGVYTWRLGPQCPAEYRPKSPAEFQRLLKEADFSYRQAFAFCPWSPEAAVNYVNLLLRSNRLDDALLVIRTYLKLDPYSAQGLGVMSYLQGLKQQQTRQTSGPVPAVAGH
jgi:hypothetical protein